MTPGFRSTLVGCAIALLSTAAHADAAYSPNTGDDFPRRVLWGDTHLHSNLSLDANMLGNRRLTAADAYRVARGETVSAQNGMKVKLRRPLDFLVVSDHAEYLGVMRGLALGDETLLQDATARSWGEQLAKGDITPMTQFAASLAAGKGLIDNPAYERQVWDRMLSFAEEYDQPGRFTALIGYEWTSMPGGNNLHRIVVFRDDADTVTKTLPFSAFDSDDPEDLWRFLDGYEKETGGQALSIAHNSNLSGGLMFGLQDSDGNPLSAEYAELRTRQEPLVEATQYKGDSEAHPFLSPNDEFADYESWDRSNIGFTVPHQDDWFAGEYARSGLRRGLEVQAKVGANPYRFGMIGSTDSHTALPTADEDDFWGKMSINEPGPERWQTTLTGRPLDVQVFQWQMAASGYAAVWAQENTRASIFDAMERRETYATTGPRMLVRFFGSFAFDPADATRPDLARTGYAKGVPMGGDLAGAATRAPSFLISALKDPDGANLDRVQVIKGWTDTDGLSHEQVFDVALSDGREVGADGQVPTVGSTVDVEAASYANTIGAVQLTTVWKDPTFDADQAAFWYVRVLEIPTPRWTSYDAKVFDLELPPEVPRTTQERAYTSPIWYTPSD
jgi:hypothetical protein